MDPLNENDDYWSRRALEAAGNLFRKRLLANPSIDTSKVDVFIKKTQIKKQPVIAIIAENGVKDNFYLKQLISGVVTLDDLFNA